MNQVKKEALGALNIIVDRIPPETYEAIKEGITDIEMLRDRDAQLEEMWDQLSDVPMNPETECIEAGVMGWGPGIHREEIWHWFDKRHSKGVAYLLYGDSCPKSDLAHLCKIKALCKECGSLGCGYNKGGICRYAMVNDAAPEINDLEGCRSYLFGGFLR